jgi:hypothetical protein
MDEPQVLYQGRWVSREHFCAFVYNKEGQKLAKSYAEFSALISSGLWSANPIKPNRNESEIVSQSDNFNPEELEEALESESNIVDMKPKRGRKCRNQLKA